MKKPSIRAVLAASVWGVVWLLTRRHTLDWELTQLITAAGFFMILVSGVPWVLVMERESRTTYHARGRSWSGNVDSRRPGLSSWLYFTMGWAAPLAILSIIIALLLEAAFPGRYFRPKFLILKPTDAWQLAVGAVWCFWCFFTGHCRWIFAEWFARHPGFLSFRKE